MKKQLIDLLERIENSIDHTKSEQANQPTDIELAQCRGKLMAYYEMQAEVIELVETIVTNQMTETRNLM